MIEDAEEIMSAVRYSAGLVMEPENKAALDRVEQKMQELEAQQAELQTAENRYGEVKLRPDSFAEDIQSGNIMNTEDSMVIMQLEEQIIVGEDSIEVHFKCCGVASHEYL